MKSAKNAKKAVFKRDNPDLPSDLRAGGEAGLSIAGDVAAIQETRLQGLERPGLKVDTLHIEGSVLEHVHLAGGQFASAVWKDARLIGCDLSNVRAHRISLVRVELIDCRLTGFTATALDWQDVLVQNSDLRYAQFQGGRFRSCEFHDCKWQESDLQNADLTAAIFRSCNLAQADLRGAALRNTDIRGSEVEGMIVGVGDLHGAIVDPSQAMAFARLLGLQIL